MLASAITLWLLDEPTARWPLFALGWACLSALCIALLEIQEGSVAGSLAFGAIAGAPLAWTGWSVSSLGYPVLGRVCIGFAAMFVLAVLVRGFFALRSRLARG